MLIHTPKNLSAQLILKFLSFHIGSGLKSLYMKRALAVLFALIGWFAVIAQFYLLFENRVASVPETIIRFFSFFTILTNIFVATYFSVVAFNRKIDALVNQTGTLTAVTLYIVIVGLIYQVILRELWEPQGLQKIVDELLHTVIPSLVLIYWFIYEKKTVTYKQIPKWLLYPFIYFIYILIRGYFSGFYPYPFVDVSKVGSGKVFNNSLLLLFLFATMAALLIAIRRVGKT